MSKWIKKGDKVVVVAGNEKGKVGEVISRREDRVLIQGVNIRKKHAKRQKKMPGAEIVEMECPIHISNVAICGEEGKPVRLSVRASKDGGKELYYLSGKKEVVHRQVRKNG